jgi:multicomponent Na+:H+ antiporter subunit D
MSGFLGKVALTQAGLERGTPLAYGVVAAGMVTSLLTLYAVGKAWNLAFWRTPQEAHEMARHLTDDGSAEDPQVLVHRDHVHVGPHTFGAGDLAEARSILDEEDGSNQDLFQLSEQGRLPTRTPRTMVGATASLLALSLGLSLVAGSLFGYAERAAEDLLDRDVYVDAVLPGGQS